MEKIKAGIFTSEFWVTVASFVMNALVMLGILTPVEADDFVKAVAVAFAAITTIVVTFFYIYGRIVLKRAVIENSAQTSRVPSPAAALSPRGDTLT